MGIVNRIASFAAIALILGACPVRAQSLPPMETVVGDPRAALEKDWGPLPLPPGATYEAECSRVRRTAIFFLGLKVDSAVLSRAAAHAKTERAKFDADREAGRPANMERLQAIMALMAGTPESRALAERTVSFLKARGMIAVDVFPTYASLQMPSNAPKVQRLGYTLAASLDWSGMEGAAPCPSAGGPTLEFGRR